VQKFVIEVCTKHWREPYNYLQNLLKLPLLNDRRTKLKLTVQFSSVHFDLITQEMLHLQLIGGFHAGPGPH